MDGDDFAHLSYRVEEGVAIVTLNTPARRNAWSGPMALEYRWALHHAHTDPDVRVVVLTGAGRYFCVGADTAQLSEISDAGGVYRSTPVELPPFPEGTPAGVRHNHAAPLTINVPVIAAINGGCAGAGFVLATYADVRWAAMSARIATSFAGLGLPPEYGIGWMLPRITGTANAFELLLDPTPRAAVELAGLRFVQRVLPDDELLPAVLAYARGIARHCSAESLRTMKRALWFDAEGDFGSAYARAVRDMDDAMLHADFRTGLAAARAKERPDFLRSHG